MPRKQKAYKVDTDKKIVYRYKGVEPTKQDEKDILMYVSVGYEIKWIKKGTTVEEMRTALARDEEALKRFNTMYESGAFYSDDEYEGVGFHCAVKFYNDWKKAKKATAKAKKEAKAKE